MAGRLLAASALLVDRVNDAPAPGAFPGLVTLATAVLVGDMGTSLGVTVNALRLSRIQADPAP